MHLHGERLLGVEKFEQQRKLRLRMVPAEERCAVLRDQLVQRLAGERAVGDDALIGAVVDDFPAFGVVVARRRSVCRASVPKRRPPQRYCLKIGRNEMVRAA